MALIKECVCGCSVFTPSEINGIEVNTCQYCGVVHQRLNMTSQQYFNFYSEEYHTSFQKQRGTPTYESRLEHDKKISQLRLNAYEEIIKNLNNETPTLDIGSSNNAFVDTLREHSIKAYGIEIGSEGKLHQSTTFNEDLLDLHFPPNYYFLITLHDVLEHFIDPSVYLDELHRIIADDGVVIIDLPNYFVSDGIHHWKRVEHLWFWTTEQATKLFNNHGFEVFKTTTPIPSKVVFYMKKIKQNVKPKKVLFMPGMGDIYWCLTKMESFIREHNLGVPEAYIWDIDQKKIGTKQRSENFLNMFPFLDYKGTLDKRRTPDFDKFYAHKDGVGGHFRNKKPGVEPKWVVTDFDGFDYVVNVNGILETGDSIVDSCNSVKRYETNWQPERFVSTEENQWAEEYKKKYGKYVFCYFTGLGVYDTTFNAVLTPQIVYNILSEIHKKTGAVAVLTGTSWDVSNSEKIMALDTKGIIFSEVNQTDTRQLMALMKNAVGVIGWPAGNTIVAASMFKKPTIMVWSKVLWDAGFAKHCVDPSAEKYTYLYVEDYKTQPQRLALEITKKALETFDE